jgi:hypothetical protein
LNKNIFENISAGLQPDSKPNWPIMCLIEEKQKNKQKKKPFEKKKFSFCF